MGLPSLNITFKAAAKEALKRAERGSVGMIVKDIVPGVNPVVVYKAKDIPETLSAETKEQINLALKGYVHSPRKIVVYVIAKESENYTEALDYFELKKVNWLCCPTVKTDAQEETVQQWVKDQRDNRNKVKAILPEIEADCEGVINYAEKTATVGEKTYTAEQFCSRIAGIMAGTPPKMSATFAVLDDVSECSKKKRKEADAEVDAGKLVLFDDGEKIKIASAVNSLTTVDKDKKKAWKKVVVVETMDMINDDLIVLTEDHYIGKYRNSYDNKCLLLTAMKEYLDEIGAAGLITDYSIELDADAIREYLITEKGMKREVVEAMPDKEVIKQDTDEMVFLKSAATVVQVMEHIELNIAV